MVGCSTCPRVPKEGGSYRNPGCPPILETQGNVCNVCTDIFNVENYSNVICFQACGRPVDCTTRRQTGGSTHPR